MGTATDVTGLGDALADAVGPEHVAAGAAVAADYAHDEALAIAAQPPAAVVRPRTTAEVAAVLRLAGRHATPVTARGTGTGLSGAAINTGR